MDIRTIRYLDLAMREARERDRLLERLNQIDRSAKARLGGPSGAGGDQPDPIYYTMEEKRERDRIAELLAGLRRVPDEWCDPLCVAARDVFNERPGLLIGRLGNPVGPIDGNLSGVDLRMSSQRRPAITASNAVMLALTLGLLIVDGAQPPPVRVDRSDLPPESERQEIAADTLQAAAAPAQEDRDSFAINADRSHPGWQGMGRAFFAAVGEAQSVSVLAELVLPILARLGSRNGDKSGSVDVEEFARLMRALVARGVTEREPQLSRRIGEALDRLQNVGGDDVVGEIGIDLPDLEAEVDGAIIADNVRLMGPVILAAMFEELKVFRVVDKLVENAQAGTLPIGAGPAGRLLYKRWKQAPNRISEAERQSLYAMTMGMPGGDPNTTVNREFNDLWLRFVSAISSYARQNEVDRLLRASLPSAIGHQQVRKAARDLALNLSLHGYGMTHYAALELQGDVKEMIALLSDPEIRAAYGARDMWQVIDQVAVQDLGGARTSSRYRTLASCGAIITAWLADNVERVLRPSGPLIDMNEVRSPMPRSSGQRATSHPTDYDLVNACELWLADTAVSDSRIEEMSQPRETPVMTSKPVPVPAFAREFFEDIPGFGFGAANGSARH